MFRRPLSAAFLGLTIAFAHALPAVAAEALIPIAAFVKYDKFRQPRLSPDGKHLAMIVTEEIDGRDLSLLNIYALDGFKLISSIRFPVFQMPFNVHWVSNTRLVVPKAEDWGFREAPIFLGEIFATDYDGKNQGYLYGKDRFSYQRNPSAAAGTVGDRGWGYLQSLPTELNGRFFLRERKWSANEASSRSFLYDVDAKTGTRKLIADVPARDLNYLLQHDGTPRFAYGMNDNNRRIVFLRDKNEDNWQQIPVEKLGAEHTPLAFTPDDKNYFLLYAEKDAPAALMRESMSSGERTLLASDPVGSIDMIQYGAVTEQPFAVATRLRVPIVRYIDEHSPDAKLHQQISKQFPGQYVHFSTFSRDGNKLLFFVYSDKEPGEYYLFDRSTKAAEFLVANRSHIDAAKMAAQTPISFTARDGLEIHGYLTIPANASAQKLPLVLHPHGGPQGVADEWFFDADSQFLASRGYAVLRVNYRGSGGRGMAFYRAGDKQWAKGMLHDMIDGVRWAIAQGKVDASRVCVYGGSYGAYAAMMMAAMEPALFKCAVGYAGLYDLPMLLKSENVKRSIRSFNFLSEVIGTDLELLRQDSPTFVASKINVPVLLVHGEQDLVTPKEQAEAMRDALAKAGKSFEWMMVPKEEHGFYRAENRTAFFQRLETFLAKHLGS